MAEQKPTLLMQLRKQGPAIASALPASVDLDRFMRAAETSIMLNPDLKACTERSVLAAFTQAAQVGLVVDSTLGQAYVLPFNVKSGTGWEKRAQLIVGYRGFMELARRGGSALLFEPRIVHQGDVFEYEYGLEPFLRHRPAESTGDEPGPVSAAYVVVRFKEGPPTFRVMHKAQIDAIRERSKAKNNGPWVTDYGAMAMKTVIRETCKYVPVSVDLLQLAMQDERRDFGLEEPRDAAVFSVRSSGKGRDAADAIDEMLGEQVLDTPGGEEPEEKDIPSFD